MTLDKSISKAKKPQQVYIITKQGKNYTEEGMKYVKEQLEKRYNEKNELIFFAGTEYNKPKNLLAALKDNNNAYVIVSFDEGIAYFPKTDIPLICKNMQLAVDNNYDDTSWEILMESANIS